MSEEKFVKNFKALHSPRPGDAGQENVKPFRESIGAGDLVTLKSGGPKMVVAERTADKAHCVWHFDNGDSCWQWFPLVVLQVSK